MKIDAADKDIGDILNLGYFKIPRFQRPYSWELDEVQTFWDDVINGMMCAEKTGGFNLVNYRHSSGVYHEQETEDLHRRIQS